jgi:hypothetical protein
VRSTDFYWHEWDELKGRGKRVEYLRGKLHMSSYCGLPARNGLPQVQDVMSHDRFDDPNFTPSASLVTYVISTPMVSSTSVQVLRSGIISRSLV